MNKSAPPQVSIVQVFGSRLSYPGKARLGVISRACSVICLNLSLEMNEVLGSILLPKKSKPWVQCLDSL